MNTFYKVETQKTLGTAVKDLKANLLAMGFGTLFELNFRDKIAEKGFSIDNDFVLIEVCHAKIASEILNANIEVGFILPCKLVVYEKENATYKGYVNNLFDNSNLTPISTKVKLPILIKTNFQKNNKECRQYQRG